MKLFRCVCGNTLHFENSHCLACQRAVGFDPGSLQMLSLDAANGPGNAAAAGQTLCINGQTYGVCNWLASMNAPGGFCSACALNRYVPDLSEPRNVQLWGRMEAAKRRMLVTLLEMGLPFRREAGPDGNGLAFEFLADWRVDPSEDQVGSPVYTGHDRGTITINLAEADSGLRESMRERMNESYRTLLGHFRHEIGHYYWDQLIRDSSFYNEFRALFGDETTDYRQALQQHYSMGPPAAWAAQYVSAYASSHPWEDWAESWAHYMHMVDTLDTAEATGFRLAGRSLSSPLSDSDDSIRPWDAGYHSFDDFVTDWARLSVALNELNRSMGQSDAYPFALSKSAIDKLAFIHSVIQDSTQTG